VEDAPGLGVVALGGQGPGLAELALGVVEEGLERRALTQQRHQELAVVGAALGLLEGGDVGQREQQRVDRVADPDRAGVEAQPPPGAAAQPAPDLIERQLLGQDVGEDLGHGPEEPVGLPLGQAEGQGDRGARRDRPGHQLVARPGEAGADPALGVDHEEASDHVIGDDLEIVGPGGDLGGQALAVAAQLLVADRQDLLAAADLGRALLGALDGAVQRRLPAVLQMPDPALEDLDRALGGLGAGAPVHGHDVRRITHRRSPR
jgi:hypothetical protein